MTWWAVGTGVASLVGNYISSRNATKAQNKVANQQGQLTTLQTDAAKQLMPWGQGLMTQGGNSLSSLLPYYTKAAFGDRATLSNLIAPELEQVRGAYDRPLQALTELSPRSGTTAASNAALLAGRGDALQRTYTGARTQGMQGLQGLAGQLSGLGTGAVGASFGGLQGASSGNLGLLSQLFNLRQQNNDQSSGIGAGLVDFLKQYQTWNAGRTQPLPTTSGTLYGQGGGWTPTPSTMTPGGGG